MLIFMITQRIYALWKIRRNSESSQSIEIENTIIISHSIKPVACCVCHSRPLCQGSRWAFGEKGISKKKDYQIVRWIVGLGFVFLIIVTKKETAIVARTHSSILQIAQVCLTVFQNRITNYNLFSFPPFRHTLLVIFMILSCRIQCTV